MNYYILIIRNHFHQNGLCIKHNIKLVNFSVVYYHKTCIRGIHHQKNDFKNINNV